MSFNAAALKLMLQKGLTLGDVVEIAAANESRSDPTAAERQARYRRRKGLGEQNWYALREQVFERDDYTCQYCGAKEDLACDHVVPLIQGGTNDIDNLTTACRSCNCGKSGRTPEEWMA